MAIPKQPAGRELQPGRKRIRLGSPFLQLCDSAARGNQDSAVIARTQCSDFLRLVFQGIASGWTRLPSPQAGDPSRPEIAFPILIERGHSGAETAVLSIALRVAALNPAESPQGRLPPADPYRSFTILEQRLDRLPLQFPVVSQLAVLPAGKPLRGANPKTSVAPGEQASDVGAGEMLPRWWLPRDGPHAVES